MTYIQRRFAKKHSHRYFVNSQTNDAECICGKVLGSKRAKPGQYTAIRCRYNGYWYDSRFEAQYAMDLDWRKRAGKLKDWQRQFPIEIRRADGGFIRRHKVDFRIHHNDDSFELVEVKGFETPEYAALKRQIESLWLPEHLDHTYLVLK